TCITGADTADGRSPPRTAGEIQKAHQPLIEFLPYKPIHAGNPEIPLLGAAKHLKPLQFTNHMGRCVDFRNAVEEFYKGALAYRFPDEVIRNSASIDQRLPPSWRSLAGEA